MPVPAHTRTDEGAPTGIRRVIADSDFEFALEDAIGQIAADSTEDEVLTAEDAEVVAMACCKNTAGACWTQM